jgi:hypothetical protein
MSVRGLPYVARGRLRACAESADAADAGGGGCERLLDELEPAAATMMRWVAKIVAVTQQCEAKNKMGLRNLTLVVAPNLFGLPTAVSLDPIDELQRLELISAVLHRLAAAAAASP